MAETKVQAVSFAPKDFVAGGLINDVDVEVESAEFTKEGPENYTEPTFFLKLGLKDMATGDIVEQWWSTGKKAYDNFEASADGFMAIPTGGSNSFTRDSNFHVFIESLVSKGFPETKCNNLSNLLKLQMHVTQIPTKQRAGMSAPKTDRERTILVCDKIIKLPGEKAGARRATPIRPAAPVPEAAAAPAAPAPESAVNGDALTQIAVEALNSVLTSEFTALRNVRAKAFTAMSAVPTGDRSAALNLISDAAWLGQQGFLFDPANGGMVAK